MQARPFGTFHAPLARVEFLGTTPRGHRLIGPLVGARLDGPVLAATQRGTSAADWLLRGPDGTTVIDVRIAMRTDDGAHLYITYDGRADWSGGIGSGPVYSAFRFDTDDPRYRWLTRRLVVGRGQVCEDHGEYALFLLD